MAKKERGGLEGPLHTCDEIRDRDKVQGLRILLEKEKEEKDRGLAQVMRDPLSIEMNAKWLWSLLRQGKVKEAV